MINNKTDFVDRYFELAICTAILFAIIVIITAETTLRAVGLSTFSWSLDVNLGLLVWITWLSTAAAIRHTSHLRFTLVRSKFSRRVNYAVYVVEWGLWLAIFGALLTSSYSVLMTRMASGATIPGTGLPRYILYISVPIGSMIILFRVLQQIYLTSTAYKNNENITPSPSIGTND